MFSKLFIFYQMPYSSLPLIKLGSFFTFVAIKIRDRIIKWQLRLEVFHS